MHYENGGVTFEHYEISILSAADTVSNGVMTNNLPEEIKRTLISILNLEHSTSQSALAHFSRMNLPETERVVVLDDESSDNVILILAALARKALEHEGRSFFRTEAALRRRQELAAELEVLRLNPNERVLTVSCRE